MHAPYVGLSLMLEEDFLRASLPLFSAGEVEILEWSFDVGWGLPRLPAWAEELLAHFSRQGRLLGHGVTFSPLSGHWTARQQDWLLRLRRELAQRDYLHISEHFGFMTAGDFHRSAPLPVPLTEASLKLGQARLQLLKDQGIERVGLENLAFAFGKLDVANQGRFLEQLLEPAQGFLVLDLHNHYCQSCNFAVPIEDLMRQYPLHRVRELHISGGSWSKSQRHEPIRRDTHDGPVPDEVFAALPRALASCPKVEAVIFERLGGTFLTSADLAQFQADFRRLRDIVRSGRHG
jgi:uncharacterized protein (UPF0276 family)